MEHVCIICGHIHNEELEGKWNELPDTFECPECGLAKTNTKHQKVNVEVQFIILFAWYWMFNHSR